MAIYGRSFKLPNRCLIGEIQWLIFLLGSINSVPIDAYSGVFGSVISVFISAIIWWVAQITLL